MLSIKSKIKLLSQKFPVGYSFPISIDYVSNEICFASDFDLGTNSNLRTELRNRQWQRRRAICSNLEFMYQMFERQIKLPTSS